MIKEEIKKFLTIDIVDEHKEEFERELVNANIIRSKVIAVMIIIIELFVIAFSIINNPEEIISKSKGYYYIMYVSLITVMVAGLLLLNYFLKKENVSTTKITILTYTVAAYTLAWNMIITLLDQASSGSLLSYFLALITISVIIFMEPKALVIINFGVQIAFIVLLPFFLPKGDSPFNEYINTTITVVISCLIGFIIYSNKAENFLQRKTIEQKNKQLKQLNEQLKESNKTLNFLSKTDGLTGIYNRRMFNEISQCFWSKCKNRNLFLTTIMMDIDYFKEYNDNFGHQAGDECLMKLVDTISSTVKQYSNQEQSILARYGGEEFVLLVCNLTCERSYQLSESIRQNVEKLNIKRVHNEVADHITLSLGVYCGSPFEDTSKNIAKYIGNADKALYTAKKSGRNVTKVFS